jgi:hypothetical protein
MTYPNTSSGHYLLEISEAEAIDQAPPHAEQDDRSITITAFEHHASPEQPEGVGQTELPNSL